MSLSNRVAIVTGGSSGIGRGIAIELAREGAKVVVADLQEAPKTGKYYDTDLTTSTAEEIERLGGEAAFIQTDVADDGQVVRMIDQTVGQFGGLDILVNNAAIHIPADSQTMSLADWDRVTAVTYRAVFVASKFAIPHLKDSSGGRIINISSIHSKRGGGGPAYPSAKAAVVNLSRDLAVELGKHGVTVNAICPGMTETAIQDYLTPEQIEECIAKTLLPRIGKPRDIARACVFLASADGEWITGTSLVVDGGWLASIM
jgi:NAD(P)-dependent dehydrogenase (short-subunit alcohol dehydrogenase family)